MFEKTIKIYQYELICNKTMVGRQKNHCITVFDTSKKVGGVIHFFSYENIVKAVLKVRELEKFYKSLVTG